MTASPPLSDRDPDPIRRSDSATGAGGRPEDSRFEELEKALEVQKELVENLKEVIQARDLEIKYLQNTIQVKERLLQNYPDDRAFNSLYVLYLNGNRLLPPGTRRRKMAARLLSLFVR